METITDKILIIDDETLSRHDLNTILGFMGFDTVVSDAQKWRQTVENNLSASAVFLGSYSLPAEKMLDGIQQWSAGVPLVLLGRSIPESLPGGLGRQIVGTLETPLKHSALLSMLHRCQSYRDHWQQAHQAGSDNLSVVFEKLVGKSDRIREVRQLMAQVADRDVTVLLTGESGTGKEVVAHHLHVYSQLKNGPFVPVNCGAIPNELLESELFGHEKGAFTGAVATRKGRFELAHGGTLFLDEIGDMPLSMQVKLLRVLQERTFERVGGSQSITVDVRIIAATHKNLEAMVREGAFREDLFYRLNVFPIHVPSLKDRPEDIPVMINELVNQMEQQDRGSIRLSSAAVLTLCRYSWPGNVRELSNLLERLSITHPYGVVSAGDLPKEFRQNAEDVSEDSGVVDLFPESMELSVSRPSDDLALLPVGGLNLKKYLANLEQSLIQQALSDSRGVVARAAEKLQIRRTTLVEKMRKYRLQRYQEEVKE
ncbi:Nitrogen assimilation regulatory protein [invertebrate metagenome]|uniref:Nitrogen assimilation regulatory protein n=1 Tax=invertebrate metagenome TaxID=1711999 RepID=A0A2H9T8F8_9ZZZZ